MAITILPENRSPLTEGLGGGLSNLLTGLAEGKARRMQQAQTAEGLSSLFGSELAQKLAPLDPLLLRELAKGKIRHGENQAFMQAYNQAMGVPDGQGMQMQPGMEQAPGMEGASPIGGGLSKQDIVALENIKAQRENLALKREQLGQRKQQAIVQANAPYLKKVRDLATPQEDVITLADRAMQLVNDPNVQLGNIQSLTQTRFANEPTQLLATTLNQIVEKKLEGVTRPSEYVARLKQLSKPQIWQKKGTIKQLLRDIKNDAQSGSYLEQRAADALIEQNNGMQPEGLETKTRKLAALSKKIASDPEAQQLPPNSTIEVNGNYFNNSHGMWLPVAFQENQ